jgi:hypothetical protein
MSLSTLNILICRKHYFQKLTKFSQENNVLGAAASYKDGFLFRDTFISSTQLDGPVGTNRADLHI